MKRSIPAVLLACASAVCVLNHLHAQLVVPHLVGIRFADRKHGWVAGVDGLFYTQNGGKTWARQRATVSKLRPTEGPVPSGFGIALRSGEVAWADESRAIVVSDDGCLTGTASGLWLAHAAPGGTHPASLIRFTDLLNGWAMTSSFVYRTQDGGQHWSVVSREAWPHSMGPAFLPISDKESWVGGERGLLGHTKDSGRNWVWRHLQGVEGGIKVLDFVGRDDGWILGSTGTGNRLVRTGDGGKHWQQQTVPFNLPLQAMSFADRKEGWLVGLQAREDGDGIILHTSDGGESWTPQSSNVREFLLAVQALQDGEAWVVGHKGTLLHTADHGATWHQVKIH